jgi:hypothetical protein
MISTNYGGNGILLLTRPINEESRPLSSCSQGGESGDQANRRIVTRNAGKCCCVGPRPDYNAPGKSLIWWRKPGGPDRAAEQEATMSRRWIVVAVLSFLPLAGAVPAAAATITYSAILSGQNEVPANASAGTGTALVTYDSTLHTLSVVVNFSGLTGMTTASHIHCCGAPTVNATVATQVPTFPGFPLGVTSGSYTSAIFDLTLASSFNPAFVTAQGGTVAGAEAALAAGLANGQTYLNVHTNVFPGGEIRGTLVAVPEPTSLFLFSAAAFGLIAKSRRHRRAEA